MCMYFSYVYMCTHTHSFYCIIWSGIVLQMLASSLNALCPGANQQSQRGFQEELLGMGSRLCALMGNLEPQRLLVITGDAGPSLNSKPCEQLPQLISTPENQNVMVRSFLAMSPSTLALVEATRQALRGHLRTHLLLGCRLFFVRSSLKPHGYRSHAKSVQGPRLGPKQGRSAAARGFTRLA